MITTCAAGISSPTSAPDCSPCWRQPQPISTGSPKLVESCADLPLGTVDASVIALTERLALPAVATLDHRHFTVVRPRHISALTLLP